MRLYLAPAAQGKTEYVIRRIRHVHASHPLKAVWVILPNREQVQAFRRRLALAGGALGVEIDTFYGVYGRVLALAGDPLSRLSDPVQHRLLRAVVDTLCDEGALAYYAPLRDKPGFLRRLRDVILELKQARIDPAHFAGVLAGEPRRLRELAAIYERYQTWLQASDWADAEGQGWLAALALEEQRDLGRAIHLLIVDGFDEFNPTQLAVLRLLARDANETIVTLTGEAEGPDRDAHRRFTRARHELCEACSGIEIRPLPHTTIETAPPLTQLEASLFAPAATTTIPAATAAGEEDTITLIEARNRAEEVRAALRWLKRQVHRSDISLHETAILLRSLEPYRPYLIEVAAEYGIPLQVAGGEPLYGNPAVAALLNLLSLPVLDWPRRQLLDAWRSPYFDWQSALAQAGGAFSSFEQATAGLAEAARGARIVGGLSQWREALQRRAALDSDAVAVENEDQSLREGPIGKEAAALLRLFDAFVKRLGPPPPAALENLIEFVEDLIGPDPVSARGDQKPRTGRQDMTIEGEDAPGHLQLVAQARAHEATAERDIAALQAFKEVLRGLLLAEHIASGLGAGTASEPMPYPRFYAELRGAVEAATYSTPRQEGDAVAVGSVLQMRGISFRAVALLGLSEGEFPQQEREEPLLRDVERRTLKLQARVQGDEITLFYEALTRARSHLLLTRPYLSDDGQLWEPSPYWQEIRRLVDAKPASAAAGDAPASLPEYLAAAGASAPASRPELDAAWQEVQHAAAVLSARQARYAAGPFEGDMTALGARLRLHYPPDHIWSSSRLEAYATCPFHFFVGSSLGLEERAPAEEGFDVLILGSIYHAVLEEIYRQARELGDWSQEALCALLPQVAPPLFDAAPRRYGFRPTPLWEYQRRELAGVIERTLLGLAEIAGDYAPLVLEAAFGLHDAPPLELAFEGATLRLRGFIDRIDQAPDGSLRIIDYKSGSTPIRRDDLEAGKRIQLPLYALAAQRALRIGEVNSGFYWHIGSAKTSQLSLEEWPEGVGKALETAVGHAFQHVEGIRAGRFHPRPPASGCPQSCPARNFCWRYRS